jgi:succinate dehydrogenase hydrophobic anchor subunit
MTSEAASVRTGRRKVQPRAGAGGRRAAHFVLMRSTGLLLAILVLGHFTLTHIVHDVADTNAAYVTRRWGSALWIAWDWSMLAAAVVHGAAGLWIAIDDYSPLPAARRRRHRLLLVISMVALTLGTVTIVAAGT